MDKKIWNVYVFLLYTAVMPSLWHWTIGAVYTDRLTYKEMVWVTLAQSAVLTYLYLEPRIRLSTLRRYILGNSRMAKFFKIVETGEIPEVMFTRKIIDKGKTRLSVFSGPPLTKKLLDEMASVIRELQKQKANES